MSDNHKCNCSAKLTQTSHLFLGEGQHILVIAAGGGTDRVLVKAHNGGLVLAGGRPAKEVACGELFPRDER